MGVLCEAMFTTWSNIHISILETLASSVPKQFFEVIKKNGGATHYAVLFGDIYLSFEGFLF